MMVEDAALLPWVRTAIRRHGVELLEVSDNLVKHFALDKQVNKLITILEGVSASN